MGIFKDYALFYDAFYAEKDYSAECDFLEILWQEHGTPPVRKVLDLGCGTGGHALILAERGYEVIGVDRSGEMLSQACAKASARNLDIRFIQEDIRKFNLGLTFDVAIAMFAVMSYQITNDDVLNTLCCVRNHLKPGGVFIFDVWFGPAVLNERPRERLNIVKHNEEKIYRLAQPSLDMIDQTVQVNYLLTGTGKGRKIQESHRLRFFFYRELDLLARLSEMKCLAVHPFLSNDKKPTELTWSVSCIYQAP